MVICAVFEGDADARVLLFWCSLGLDGVVSRGFAPVTLTGFETVCAESGVEVRGVTFGFTEMLM